MASRFARWPAGVQAAVSLTFDDALDSQLAVAVPLLEAYGVRGTFYVNPGPGSRFERDLARWRAVHQQGHELGNHTLRHPCSGEHPFVEPGQALERWSLAEIEADVLAASARLRALVPAIGRFSFAYPCGESFVGGGPRRQSYEPVIARHFTVARALGGAGNDPATCRLHRLESWVVHEVGAPEVVAAVERAVAVGQWAILCFHGVGGDYLAVEPRVLRGLLRWLAGLQPRVWIDTVQAVGEYVAAARADSLRAGTGQTSGRWAER
ncbi:polysaccharide deacetylase family protein [Geochorda subterranea]|uniref:Polysaccharide deacetylase family protein n=1 Tax=Geochorda subterranea TaxID=3109564 RepID=A0ABZ1BMQ5_9FIRM|nr:polysaccharide deacetylase family protein [Limnochorda sp. LNt]WRP13775.1 polysaccharide deacetylase family protein [Limnochorda sp. LNt]